MGRKTGTDATRSGYTGYAEVTLQRAKKRGHTKDEGRRRSGRTEEGGGRKDRGREEAGERSHEESRPQRIPQASPSNHASGTTDLNLLHGL